MASIVTRIELDIEQLVEHIRAMLAKDPKAEIHINPPKDSTIKIGNPRPASASPTHVGGPGHPH